MIVVSLFIVIHVYNCYACFSNLPMLPPQNASDPQNSDPNAGDRVMWNNWPPPEGLGDFETWRKEFLKRQAELAAEAGDKDGKPGDAGPDWPEDWNGLAQGFFGAEPPPWAFVPKISGKPSFCFLPPDKGNCSQNLHRYGYNPFEDDCRTFTYSGCLGNQNNFQTLQKCREACLGEAYGGCDMDSHLRPEDLH